MLPDSTVPLAEESMGVSLETDPRLVQNGGNSYTLSLNPEWLAQLCLREQGAPTVHSFATRPVEVRRPAIIVQPASEVLRE